MIFYANTESLRCAASAVRMASSTQTLKVEAGTFLYLVLNRLWERERSRTIHRLGCVLS